MERAHIDEEGCRKIHEILQQLIEEQKDSPLSIDDMKTKLGELSELYKKASSLQSYQFRKAFEESAEKARIANEQALYERGEKERERAEKEQSQKQVADLEKQVQRAELFASTINLKYVGTFPASDVKPAPKREAEDEIISPPKLFKPNENSNQ